MPKPQNLRVFRFDGGCKFPKFEVVDGKPGDKDTLETAMVAALAQFRLREGVATTGRDINVSECSPGSHDYAIAMQARRNAASNAQAAAAMAEEAARRKADERQFDEAAE